MHTSKDIITLSQEAQNHLLTMIQSAPKDTKAIRLGLKNAGCAGMSYQMDFTDEITEVDEIISFDHFKIAIDRKSFLFLLGLHIDYETSSMRSGFTFKNPNQTDACGCGESVKLEAAPPLSN